MAKTIVLDNVELTQVILMKDRSTGRVLVRATYQVKAGNEVVKTTPDRVLTFAPPPGQTQQPADLMNAQEVTAASAAWSAIQAAIERAELT